MKKGGMKVLTLTIKKKWYDMILSGEKKEEYRDIKKYYEKRFQTIFGCGYMSGLKKECPKETIRFRNGYREDSPSFVAECTLKTGEGRQEWGAEKGKKYFIIEIHRVFTGFNEGNDCDFCENQYIYNGDVEGCRRKDMELKCLYKERQKTTIS